MDSFKKKHGKSSLDLFQDRIDGKLPNPPIMETMGMKIIQVEKGSIQFEATPGERHLNSQGIVHGGFAASVLDSVTGCAVQTLLGAERKLVTLDLNINFFKPILIDCGPFYAKGSILHISKRIGSAEGMITDDKGTRYAHATGTFMLLA